MRRGETQPLLAVRQILVAAVDARSTARVDGGLGPSHLDDLGNAEYHQEHQGEADKQAQSSNQPPWRLLRRRAMVVMVMHLLRLGALRRFGRVHC